MDISFPHLKTTRKSTDSAPHCPERVVLIPPPMFNRYKKGWVKEPKLIDSGPTVSFENDALYRETAIQKTD
jgi:hypothetical protein